jgi:alkanesulfonate monooxygenase SsuD/methylene tetrahydromethanopterin reductase-like flavin-dependent oxidoreductase (luciferase family)
MIRCAIDIAPLGELSDPRAIVRLAVTAEAAGWDGVSIWDSLGVSMGTSAAEPFVALTAIAQATSRLRLITSVISLPRRRPQLVAQAVGTLDRLSGGRCVLGVGAGGDMADFEPFDEPTTAAARLSKLDEGLELVDRFLRGETIDHPGVNFTFRGAAVGPAPIQRPRPPIWIGGMRPGALRRAARYHGWIAIGVAEDGSKMALAPDDLGTMVDRLRERVDEDRAYDVAVFGLTDPSDRGRVAAYADAGATWWLESLSLMRGSIDQLREIVDAGPPTAPGNRRFASSITVPHVYSRTPSSSHHGPTRAGIDIRASCEHRTTPSVE